jgi:hypothetical protein
VRGDALTTFAAAGLRQLGTDKLLELSPAERAPRHCPPPVGRSAQAASVEVGMPRPAASRDGWSTLQSVIELVDDELPFLVESTTMGINRQAMAPNCPMPRTAQADVASSSSATARTSKRLRHPVNADQHRVSLRRRAQEQHIGGR